MDKHYQIYKSSNLSILLEGSPLVDPQQEETQIFYRLRSFPASFHNGYPASAGITPKLTLTKRLPL